MILHIMAGKKQINITPSPEVLSVWDELNEHIGPRERYKTFIAAILRFLELPRGERDELVRMVSHAMGRDDALVRLARSGKFSIAAKIHMDEMEGPISADKETGSRLIIDPANHRNKPATRTKPLGHNRAGSK